VAVLALLTGWTASAAGTDCIPRPSEIVVVDPELAALPACPNMPGTFYSLEEHDDLVDDFAGRRDRYEAAEAIILTLNARVRLLEQRLALDVLKAERLTLEKELIQVKRRGFWRRILEPCAGLGISAPLLGDLAGQVYAPTVTLTWPCVPITGP
jgi:hypothetical protein